MQNLPVSRLSTILRALHTIVHRFLSESRYERSNAKLSVWSTIDSLEDFAFDIIQNFCWLMNAMFRPELKHRRFGTSSFLPSSLIRCYRSIHFRIFVCDEILINVFGHEKTDFCRKSSISCPSKLTKYFIVSFNLLRDKRIECKT